MSDMATKRTRPFSRRFAAALEGYMRERDISQRALAHQIDRSYGYVSEHLSGLRPPDTDMLDAVADLAGISSRHLYEELGRRMASAEAPAARDREDEDVDETAARLVRSARDQALGGSGDTGGTGGSGEQAQTTEPEQGSKRHSRQA